MYIAAFVMYKQVDLLRKKFEKKKNPIAAFMKCSYNEIQNEKQSLVAFVQMQL